jgi:hypothetical protein
MAGGVSKRGAKLTEKVVAVKEVRRGTGMTRVYSSNPFMVEVDTKIRRVVNRTGDMVLIARDGGDVKAETAGFWEAHEVDATQFIKLFVSGVKMLKELTSAGTRVFEVLYLRIQSEMGKDLVNLGFWMVDQNITPMSERTYARGMSELIEKGFIAATPTQGLYWLNPSYVWNGDRLAFVKEYRRRPTPKPVVEVNDQPPLFRQDELS